jgi:hypothetical protein
MAETCEESSVLCSLNELYWYACNNPSTIPSPCSPLCSQGGVGHNTSWWGFVSQGGTATLTFKVGSCTSSQGLQYGIWADCNCGQEIACRSIPCIPPNSVSTITVNLIPCKTYYLWVDGCSGDICDFTIITTGGGPPSLTPLGFINNIPRMIIEPVCVGACNFLFFVNPQPGACEPTYVWTLDEDEVGGNSNQVRLDFPEQGDFVICVTAYIGNPQSGSICSQEGPRCATVKVRPIADKPGKPRTICWEAANPGGYKWHSQRILTSGIYKQNFRDQNCCVFDSIVEFAILPLPVKKNVFFISCNNQAYIDLLGRSYFGCQDKLEINLNKSTESFGCDSVIVLTAIKVDFNANWKANCQNGKIELSPKIGIIRSCLLGETYQFKYKWYLKNDTTKSMISSDEYIYVNASNEDYCVEVKVLTQIDTLISVCTKTFCENYNESDFGVYAGQDSKQKGIFAKLNANSGSGGIWTKVSGPGNAVFQNPKDPKSRVRIDVYGRYCFEWFVDEMNCISRDTVCVDFYQIKITDPDTPNKDLEERRLQQKFYFFNLLLPNPLLSGSTVSMRFEIIQEVPVSYTWYDLQGRAVSGDQILLESGQKFQEIKTPLIPGFYILVLECNGIRELHKVVLI